MGVKEGVSFDLPNNHSYFSSFSISAHSASYILTSEDELDPDFLRYLFEKNKIIFIMDGFRKTEKCIEIEQNANIKFKLLYLNIILVKRVYVENYYILRLMETNFNIFNIKSYQRISE